MRRKKLVTIVAFVLCFFVFIPFVHAEDKTVNEKARENCLNYHGAKYIIDQKLCPGAKVTFPTIPVINDVSDYREVVVSIESYGASCREETWNKNIKKAPDDVFAYCEFADASLLRKCKDSCTEKINSCSGAQKKKVEKFCSDACDVDYYSEKSCDAYQKSAGEQDVQSCVDNCAQTSGDAIREDCERVCKNYDSVYAKYKDAEGSVCSWTGNRQNVINAIATRENHIQIDAKNVCTDTCTEDIIPIIQEKASGIVFSKNNVHGATEGMARTYGKTECNTTCKTVSSSAIEEGAICTNYNLSVDVDYNEKVKPQLDTLADQAIEKMKKDYGVNESETEEETPSKEYGKPGFPGVSREGGCVIMGDDLSNLLGEIYKWARGGCAAVIVILGVLDFLKATASDDPATLKKSGSTFVKRILVLAVFILLPYLLDFILDLLLGTDFETCMDPFK